MANRAITKKVRLDAKEADDLRRLAKARGQTESDLMREALQLLQARNSRMAAIERYTEFLGDEEEPPKVRFRLK